MPSTSSRATEPPVWPAEDTPHAAGGGHASGGAYRTGPGGAPDPEISAELDRLEGLAHRMDTLFRLPVIGARVGLDTILGLIPGIGDTASALPAGYIVYRGHRMGAPKPLVARMAANAGIDWALGTIPLIGDLFDWSFKANRRNVALLRRHFEGKPL